MEGATTAPAAAAAAPEVQTDSAAEAAATPARKPKTPRAKSTFTLHDPTTMQVIGKLSSSDPRYAALKAASKAHTRILLRKTGTRVIREYSGSLQVRPLPRREGARGISWPTHHTHPRPLPPDAAVQKLDTPQIVKRGEREISYSNKPYAKYIKQWEWAGASEAAMKQETENA